MSDLIKKFYKNAGTIPVLLARKTEIFERNPDIAQEFEYWITNKKFKSGGIEEQGYTAERLASISEYLNGEGAFALLVELRENPDKALKRIKGGFKKK